MTSIKLSINDYPYFFNKPLTIFQSILLATGVSISRFCFHIKLTIAGNCRICLIEEKKSAKPVLACSTLISNGMQIYTYSKTVKKGREGVIEYLLINHPLDCPICDQGGECDLQDQTIVFGSDRSRFYETHKRAVESKNYSPIIKFMLNRCIHCSRCVRFLNEVSQTYSLSLLGRGLTTEISGYLPFYGDYTELSGNIIDLCPVGALTSKPYSFLSRPWELIDTKFIDFFDTSFSSIKINFRGFDIVRILPSISLNSNGEWISDKIRFSYDAFMKQRLITPTFFLKNNLFYLTWKNLFISYKFFFINNINFFYYKKKNNFLEIFIGKFIDYNLILNLKNICFLIFDKFNWLFDNKFLSFSNDKSFDTRNFIVSKYDLESFDNIFLINSNLRYENPVLNLNIKQSSYVSKNKYFFYFGYLHNFSSSFIFLGNNFKNILQNNFIFSKSTLILASFNNSNFLNNYFYNLMFFFKNTNLKFISFNVLFPSTLLINELNIINKNFFLNFYNSFIFNFSFDEIYSYFNNIIKYNLIIYQGHHGEYFSSLSNILIPTSFSFEKQIYFFINIWGYIVDIKSSFYRYTLNNLKEDWKILIALKEFILLNKKEKANSNIHFLNLLPKYISLNIYFFNLWNNIFYSNYKIFNFKNNQYFIFVNNYFLSDHISRISKIMSLCSMKFLVYNDYKFIRNIIF